MYIVAVVEDMDDKGTGYYAYCFREKEGGDIFFGLNCIGGLKSAEAYKTKCKAVERVHQLRRTFRENGEELFPDFIEM